MFHYIVIGRKACESFEIFDIDRFQKSTHVEGSVGGLSVGLLSVLSHYTSIECNIHAVFNSFLRIY